MSEFVLKKLASKLDTIDKRITTLTKENLDLSDPIKFISQIRTNPKKVSENWSWVNRDYLFPLYRDPSHNIIIVKGRQMEMTEYAVNIFLYYALAHQGTYVYTVPKDEQVSRFSNDRLKKALTTTQEDILKPYVKDTAVHRIALGHSIIYLYTSWGEFASLRGIPADGIVFDEFADMDIDAISVAEEMMSHSKMKKMWIIGTPREIGHRFDQLWQLSDQKEWSWETNSWQPQNPKGTLFSGYHISQLYAVNAPNINERFISSEDIETKRLTYPAYRFANEVLGEFHAGIQRPITPGMVQDMMIEEKFPRYPSYVYAGVDWGRSSTDTDAFTWFVALQPSGTYSDSTTYDIVYLERIDETDLMKQAEIIERLIYKLNPRRTIVDIGFGQAQYQYLSKIFSSQVLPCEYSRSIKNPFKISESTAYGTLITADRNTWIDDWLVILQNRRIRIYTDKDPILKKQIINDMSSLYMEINQGGGGKESRKWVHSSDTNDDCLQSCVYALMAHKLDMNIDESDQVVSFGNKFNVGEFLMVTES